MVQLKWLKHSVDASVREALWQYFIDHSKIQQNGYYGILFYTKDEDDFWRRVEFRYRGDYKRYDVEERGAVHRAKDNRAVRVSKVIYDIEHNGGLWKRCLLGLYRAAKFRLFGD